MCQSKSSRDAENGTGQRDSDMRPKLPDDLPPKKKALYMDEAISKISKYQMQYWLKFDFD